ncbi:uncharacterized protein ARMOST_21814 [Armillaria ostoyae]|uniref:Uncharacterized protein n=1 Tax=Armillaria ostoyae TaxID=47428 RepID=A0A284SB85_ARMOS|nr:uncharacterized protein ARMOST_21814 [Armillaria ostoyae]
MQRGRNSPNAWPNDALFHGIDEETDATNVFSGQKFNDSSFPDAIQISFDSNEQSWDHGIELGSIDGEYEITAVSTFAKISPEESLCECVQCSTFDEVRNFTFTILGATQRNNKDFPPSFL